MPRLSAEHRRDMLRYKHGTLIGAPDGPSDYTLALYNSKLVWRVRLAWPDYREAVAYWDSLQPTRNNYYRHMHSEWYDFE